MRKLILSTLIILGIITSTQAQSNSTFDFSCADGVETFDDSSYDAGNNMLVVNSDTIDIDTDADDSYRIQNTNSVTYFSNDVDYIAIEAFGDGVFYIEDNVNIDGFELEGGVAGMDVSLEDLDTILPRPSLFTSSQLSSLVTEMFVRDNENTYSKNGATIAVSSTNGGNIYTVTIGGSVVSGYDFEAEFTIANQG